MIASLLSDSIAAHRDRPAVIDGGATLTYGELAKRASRMARGWADAPPGPIGGLFGRGIPALVFTVAAIRVGRTFVPLDPRLTAAEVEALADRLGLAAVAADGGVTRTRTAGRPLRTGEVPGYVMLTSGTTGRQKAVLGSARGLVNYLTWQRCELGHGPDDVFANMTPPWFDFSFKETLAALASGATVAVAPVDATATARATAGWLVAARPTVLCLLPSRFAQLVALAEAGHDWWHGVRQLMVSGEALRSDLVMRWQRLGTPAQRPVLTNLYGPTESTVVKLRYRVPEPYLPSGPTVPLGAAIPGTSVELRPTADGYEICLHGADLALGYADDLGAGATRFEGDGPDRILRTGDLGRMTADGFVEFLGRIDGTVKRRGVAISMLEIEQALACHPAVGEVAAAASSGSPPVVGLFFTGRPGGAAPDIAALRQHLLGGLPTSQMPDVLRAVERIPLTDRGKVDRAALAGLLPG